MVARYEQAFLQDVRDKNDIVGLVGEYVHLTRKGGRYWGLCPFHSEKTSSFSVHPEKQFYYCFGCKATGNVFQFLMDKERLTFPEVVAALAKRAKLPLPQEELTPAEEEQARERKEIHHALDFATRFFEHHLRHSPAGQETLAYLQHRGLTDQTIARFRLGHAPDSFEALWRSARQHVSAQALVKAGLIQARERGDGYYDRFRGRAMFPIMDLRGRVIGFGGRAVRPDQVPKYYNSPDGPYFNKRLHVYGLHLAKEAMRTEDIAIVTEGYMDAIALHQAGFSTAVASLGTSLTREHAELLRRQCSQVVIAYDADLAGRQATLKGLDTLVQAGCSVRVLQIPEGKDPDEFVQTHGAEAFRRALAVAVPLLEFKVRLALERHAGAGNTAETKAAAVREVIPVLLDIEDAVRRDEYLRYAAAALGIREEALRIETRRRLDEGAESYSGQYSQSKNWNNTKVLGKQETRPRADSGPKRPGPAATAPAEAGSAVRRRTDPLLQAERAVLRILLQHPRLLAHAEAEMTGRDWAAPEYGSIYTALAAQAGAPAAGLLARILSGVESPGARALVAELEDESPYVVQPERELLDALDTIRKERDQRRLRALQAIIREREGAGEPVETALLLEFQEIVRRTRRQ